MASGGVDCRSGLRRGGAYEWPQEGWSVGVASGGVERRSGLRRGGA